MSDGPSLIAHRQRCRLRGVSADYVRGGAVVTLTGIRSPNPVLAAGAEGLEASGELWDWIFAAEDLVLSAAQTTPAEGDELTAADGLRYRVLAIGGGEVWRYSDDAAELIRVHTRRIPS